MGFCPICKYEYNLHVTVCPDCNEALVDRLPEKSPSAVIAPDDSWVGVCRVAGGIGTEMAKGALDSNNIPSIVTSGAFRTSGQQSGLQSMLPPLSGSADVLMVPREFRQEAEIILEAVLGEDYQKLDARP